MATRSMKCNYQMPSYSQTGVGRLIRDADDRGVLVICDNRLVMRPYGATFLQSAARATHRDIARAVRFLAIPSSVICYGVWYDARLLLI